MARLALRKTWRICAIIFPLVYYFSNKVTAIFIILPVLCFFFFIEFLRFSFLRFNERLFVIFGYILKEKERKTLLGTTIFLVSVLLTLMLFRKEIAITAMLFLIFADSASAVVGTYFGRTKILNKSLEGSLAFLVTCLLIGLLTKLAGIGLAWPVIIAGAFTATVTEFLPLPVDDNFTIALSSGIVMEWASRIF